MEEVSSMENGIYSRVPFQSPKLIGELVRLSLTFSAFKQIRALEGIYGATETCPNLTPCVS